MKEKEFIESILKEGNYERFPLKGIIDLLGKLTENGIEFDRETAKIDLLTSAYRGEIKPIRYYAKRWQWSYSKVQRFTFEAMNQKRIKSESKVNQNSYIKQGLTGENESEMNQKRIKSESVLSSTQIHKDNTERMPNANRVCDLLFFDNDILSIAQDSEIDFKTPETDSEALKSEKGNNSCLKGESASKRKKTALKRKPSENGLKFANWWIDELKPASVTVKDSDTLNYALAYDKLAKTYDKATIINVCKFARQDDFIAKNFLSPLKLIRKNPDKVTYFEVYLSQLNLTKQHAKNGFKTSSENTSNPNQRPKFRARTDKIEAALANDFAPFTGGQNASGSGFKAR